MTNLLHLVVSLVDDPAAREGFRSDPDGAVAGIDDLTGEDVAAVVDVVRARVDPERSDALVRALDLRIDDGTTPRDAAMRSLLAICTAADA